MLEEHAGPERLPGVSIATLHAGRIDCAAAGTINVTTGVAVTAETVMHIGSIGKVFNATLVMQLVDEGKIQLKESVRRYLPDLKLSARDTLQRITVEMLLNHTSGIDGDSAPDHGHDEETIEKAVLRLKGSRQLHRPGAEYSYCNAATVLAGYLVQRVTGESWHQLMRERIFRPLQLEHAVTLPEDALLHRAGVGHYLSRTPVRRWKRVSKLLNPIGLAPAGTTFMVSARDLLTFASMHIRNGLGPNGTRIFSESSARAMRERTVDNRDKGYTYTEGVGLGWMICGNEMLHHSGGGPGITSVLYVCPRLECAIAVLANAEFSVAWRPISALVAHWMKKLGLQAPSPTTTARARVIADAAGLDKLAGVYENVSDRFHVLRTREGLALSVHSRRQLYEYSSSSATPGMPLVRILGNQFLLEPREDSPFNPPHDFRFLAFRNPNGEGVMQHLGNGDRLYLRASQVQ